MAKVLSIGSMTLELQELVINVFRFCIQHNIQLVPKWMPREEVFADEISKSIDVDDYMLSGDIILLCTHTGFLLEKNFKEGGHFSKIVGGAAPL